MELLLILVLGLIAGVAIGNAVGGVRVARMRRPRDLAVDAELQAARQRAERAAGEAQALRTKLAAADVLSVRVVELETDLAAAYEDAERNAELASRLESEIATLRGGRRTRPAVPDAAGTRRSGTVAARAAASAASDPIAAGAIAALPNTPDVAVPAVASAPGTLPGADPLPPAVSVAAAPTVDAGRVGGQSLRATSPLPMEPLEPVVPEVPPVATWVEAPHAEVILTESADGVLARESVEPLAPEVTGLPPIPTPSPSPVQDATAPIGPGRPRRSALAGRPAENGSPDQPPTPTAPATPILPPPDSEPSPAIEPALIVSAASPSMSVAPEPEPHEIVAAPHAQGWRPIRPGLSDPWTWLGTTSPSGIPYAEDDLQSVHGVGPYLARRLREEGVLTWRQMTEWDEDDMTLVSRRIGSFPDRIRREDWSGSAKELHEARYGERLP